MSRSSVKGLICSSFKGCDGISLEEELNKVEDTVNEDVTLIEQDLNAAFEYSDELNADLDCVSSFHSTVNKADIEEKGIDQSSVEIMNEAIEGMCRRHGLGLHRRIRLIDTSTKEGRIRQGKIALEGTGGFLDWLGKKIKEIWKYIKELFGKLFGTNISYFKRAIKEAYETLKEDTKDSQILAKGLGEKEIVVNNVKLITNYESKAILSDLKTVNFSEVDVKVVEADEFVKMISSVKPNLIMIMKRGEDFWKKFKTSYAEGSKVEENKAKEMARSVLEKFSLSKTYANYCVYDKRDDIVENIAIGPTFSLQNVNSLTNDVKELYNVANSINENKITDWLDNYVENIIKNAKITKDSGKEPTEEEKKEALEVVRAHAEWMKAIVKNCLGFVPRIGYLVLVASSSIKAQIKAIKKELGDKNG